MPNYVEKKKIAVGCFNGEVTFKIPLDAHDIVLTYKTAEGMLSVDQILEIGERLEDAGIESIQVV